jgi:hypothetical protein
MWRRCGGDVSDAALDDLDGSRRRYAMPDSAPRFPIHLVVAAALAVAAAGARAAPDAQKLAAATAAQPAGVETLKTLAAIESGSRDVEGLAKMAAQLDDRLKALGFKTERRRATPGAGADVVIGPSPAAAGAGSCCRPTWTPSTSAASCRASRSGSMTTSFTARASPTTRAASR